MRSNVCTLILAAASLAPSALLAQPLDPAAGGGTIIATAPGKGVAARVAQITASVETVDSAKRTVTLKGPAGDTVTLAVGPDVRNFDQIRVGDLVAVRYLESLTLGSEARHREPAHRPRRDGQSPAGRTAGQNDAHEVHVVADVIAVDPLPDRAAARPDASGGPAGRRPGAVPAGRGRRPGRSHLHRSRGNLRRAGRRNGLTASW